MMTVIYRDEMMDMEYAEFEELLMKIGMEETYGCSETLNNGWTLYSADEDVWAKQKEEKVVLVSYNGRDNKYNMQEFCNRDMAEQALHDDVWENVGFWEIKTMRSSDYNSIMIDTKEGNRFIWKIIAYKH